jgi:hypothetical protein
MRKWIKSKGKKNSRANVYLIAFRLRHVVTELLATEQVYVEELRIVIEVMIDLLNKFVWNCFI